MNALLFLIPISIILGLVALVAFLWSVRTEQYLDLDGDQHRILFTEDPKAPSKHG